MSESSESPNRIASAARSPITDELLRQMIDGEGTIELEISDVSDRQLYGAKHSRRLTDDLADRIQKAGFKPNTYQAVLWQCSGGALLSFRFGRNALTR